MDLAAKCGGISKVIQYLPQRIVVFVAIYVTAALNTNLSFQSTEYCLKSNQIIISRNHLHCYPFIVLIVIKIYSDKLI